MDVRIISHTPDPEKVCAIAAALTHSKKKPEEVEKMDDDSLRNILSHVMDLGHLSVVEHASFTFAISGVSRALTHQLVRHRIASYSQLSQRYVDESNVLFVQPHAIELLDDEEKKEYSDFLAGARQYCQKLAETLQDRLKDETDLTGTDLRKAARGAARSILPNAAETKLMFSANARALRHMIETRCHPAADREIRDLFYRIWEIVKDVSPAIFGDYIPIVLEDGSKALTNTSKKV